MASLPEQPRLTVAIPLYHATPWQQNVAENIRRIPAGTRIILSDEISSDDSAQQIAAQFSDDPRIELRMRNGQRGWREHFNALIAENDSEFFSLLPQDDLVEPGYYEKLVAALDANPHAGLAFGSLVAAGKRSRQQKLVSAPFPLGHSTPWLEAILLQRYWNMNLGIAFRGVIRRGVLGPIHPTPADEYADLMWVFGMALKAFMVEVPGAVYLKRYYAANTHGHWQPLTAAQRKALLVAEIHNVFGEQPLAEQVIGCLEQVTACPETTCERIYAYAKRFIPEWLLRRR